MEFVDDGVACLFERWNVVVVEEGVAAAVAAGSVAFFDDSFLAGVGVALSARGVDRPGLGVVDEDAEKRLGAICAITLAEMGVPSSRVQPSPRTWSTSSVSGAPVPPVSRVWRASVCCWARVGGAADA